MGNYLVAKCGNTTKSYTLKSEEPAKPYLRVSDGYLPLTTNTSQSGIKVKINNQEYNIQEGYNIIYTETYTDYYYYNGYKSFNSDFSIIAAKATRTIYRTSANNMNISINIETIKNPWDARTQIDLSSYYTLSNITSNSTIKRTVSSSYYNKQVHYFNQTISGYNSLSPITCNCRAMGIKLYMPGDTVISRGYLENTYRVVDSGSSFFTFRLSNYYYSSIKEINKAIFELEPYIIYGSMNVRYSTNSSVYSYKLISNNATTTSYKTYYSTSSYKIPSYGQFSTTNITENFKVSNYSSEVNGNYLIFYDNIIHHYGTTFTRYYNTETNIYISNTIEENTLCTYALFTHITSNLSNNVYSLIHTNTRTVKTTTDKLTYYGSTTVTIPYMYNYSLTRTYTASYNNTTRSNVTTVREYQNPLKRYQVTKYWNDFNLGAGYYAMNGNSTSFTVNRNYLGTWSFLGSAGYTNTIPRYDLQIFMRAKYYATNTTTFINPINNKMVYHDTYTYTYQYDNIYVSGISLESTSSINTIVITSSILSASSGSLSFIYESNTFKTGSMVVLDTGYKFTYSGSLSTRNIYGQYKANLVDRSYWTTEWNLEAEYRSSYTSSGLYYEIPEINNSTTNISTSIIDTVTYTSLTKLTYITV